MKLSSIFLLAMGLVAPTAAIPIITSSSDLPANVTIAEAIELLSAQIDTSDIQSLETDASSRGSVANTVELGTDELLLWGQTSRGNVPDVTDLSVDIVSEEAAAAAVARITRQETDLEITDRLIFNTGISTFLYFKSKGQPTTLDWSDDGCSSSPDRPLGFNFLNSCQRHDFGYRNFKAQGRFTEANRLRLDNRFKEDLYAICVPYSPLQQATCKVLADTYYTAVRLFGGI